MQLSIEELKQKFLRPLPGALSHLKMSPSHREEDFSGLNGMMPLAKRSAVLVLLFPDKGQLKTVFIKRSEYDGVHSGQISFPGGQYESTDKNFETTALRETKEEIGVESDKIQLIGQLTDFYIPPSNFLVKVFVGYSTQKPKYVPDKRKSSQLSKLMWTTFMTITTLHKRSFIPLPGKCWSMLQRISLTEWKYGAQLP